MNAPETIKPATDPINIAHEVLLKSDEALCVHEVARAIFGSNNPKKADLKDAGRMLKELADLGLIEMEPRAGGVPFYRLIAAPAVGDSEGGETDAPAAINDTPKFGHGLSCGACHDGCAGEQCKVERDSPPVDSQREEFTLLVLIADIRSAAGDPDGRLMQDELVQHIAGVVKERDDLRERLDAQIKQWQSDTGELAKKARRLTADLDDMTRERDLLKAENLALKTLEGSMPGFGAEHQEQRINSLTTDVINTRNALTNAINEADRLRAELATERQAREALQEAINVVDAEFVALPINAKEYVLKSPWRKFKKQSTAKSAATAEARRGKRTKVFALVPIGEAIPGAEWRGQ